MKTRSDYLRYEQAARSLAAEQSDPVERDYFTGRADLHAKNAARCAEGSPVGFLLIQQSEDPRLAGGPDAIFYYGPDAIEMEDVPSWLRGA